MHIKRFAGPALALGLAMAASAQSTNNKGYLLGYVGIANAQETDNFTSTRDVYGFSFGASYVHPLSTSFGIGANLSYWSLERFNQFAPGIEIDYRTGSKSDLYFGIGKGTRLGFRYYAKSEAQVEVGKSRPFYSFEFVAPNQDIVQSLFTINIGIRF